MALLSDLTALLGATNLLTGADAAPWARDVSGHYEGAPLAVARPRSTPEVAAVLRLAAGAGVAVVPASGRTGLTGATHAPGALVLSLDRMRAIRGINPATRTITAEAGATIQSLRDAAEAAGFLFPLTFGAQGQAGLGGVLSTNAGGSNVLRYGSTRGLCLGVEVVLADGRVLDLMGELHKDNSGYALRELFIGAEGTLGVITAAVMRLASRPPAYATAMVACASLDAALALLGRLDAATGGAVEAFEFMPRAFIDGHLRLDPAAREPFDAPHEVNILVELGARRAADAVAGPDGTVPLDALLEGALAQAMEDGLVLDAVPARSGPERRAMWARREAAAAIAYARPGSVDTDVALPLDRVGAFLDTVRVRLAAIEPMDDLVVAHLGDGNVHLTAYPPTADHDRVREVIDATAVDLGGTFSAEHGIGLSKLSAMAAHKDAVALDVMRALKAALDPEGRMNPGKVVPGTGAGR